MHYVMSDIHGCYKTFKEMLQRIEFTSEDILYIAGDVLDRGQDPIGLLVDIMSRPNVVLLKGNHEDMALSFLKCAGKTGNLELLLAGIVPKNMRDSAELWVANGGEISLLQLLQYGKEYIEKFTKYLEHLPEYEQVYIDQKCYVIVHAGLGNFAADRRLDSYSTEELVWDEVDYERVYYKDKFLVTGHTPTVVIDQNMAGRIIKKNNHIAIDCGCSYGGRMGCLCLETCEEYYQDMSMEE